MCSKKQELPALFDIELYANSCTEKWTNISKNVLQHRHSGRQRTVKGIVGGGFGGFMAIFTNENQPKSNYQLRKQLTFLLLFLIACGAASCAGCR
jgi:hypothetical protein